ncbi:hypothetical protein JHK85_006601 [Glycine max]|nr:hypothetical protein JHK85_006601 [Glycine max]KAG5071205.1 hypothetical protein JHK86_006416 [Glycine max]
MTYDAQQIHFFEMADSSVCKLLKERKKIKDTRFLTVQEHVAIFFVIIYQTTTTRSATSHFQHSIDIIHRHVKHVLEDCVGAIDGTHILACIPKDLQILSRRSQLEPTINVLCCCSFVMKFTCVMNLDNHFPISFLLSYHGERYHLRDYRSQQTPQSPLELFNYMHSSLKDALGI